MRPVTSAFILLMGTTALLPVSAAGAQELAVAQRGVLEEIMVTAQRREQSMQDVPIAVSAITSRGLEAMGISGTSDLSIAVPGLFMSKTSTAVQPFLRGVGTASLSPGNDPSVPVYIDGVYHSSPYSLFFSFNNIERVEVLKGPQGTLFGRNSTGGLIQVVTKDPTEETTAKVSVGYGRFEAFETNAYVSGGTEKIAADLAVIYKKQSDGWGKNLYKPADSGPIVINGRAETSPEVDPRAGYGEEFGIRSKVVLRASDETTAKLSFMYTEADTDMNHYRDLLPGQIGLNGWTKAGGFYDYNSDTPWRNRNHHYLVTGEVQHEIDFATVKSITSYMSSDAKITVPSDGSPYVAVGFDANLSIETFTQEVQLLSNGNSGPDWLEWIAGVYYLDSTAAYDPLQLYHGNHLQPNFNRQSHQYSKSLAGYGQFTADVTDTTRLTLGLRYTDDHVRADQYSVGTNPYAASFTTALGSVWNMVPIQKESFSKLTGRVVLDQKLAEDVMVYGSFSRGYKAGQLNHGGLCAGATVGQCFNVQPPVRPETLDAYEIGLKSDLLDNRLRLNLSGFYYDYKDLQVQTVVGVPAVSMLANAATARVYGVELDGVAQVTENFYLNFGATYLDAKYKSSPNAVGNVPNPVGPAFGNSSIIFDASGNDLTQAPSFVMNMGGNLTIPTDIGDFDLNANVYYNDGFYWDQQNTLKEGSYTIVNAQAAYQVTDNWRVRIWGKNLLDKKYYGYQTATGNGSQGAPAAPLTFGFAVDWEL